jgi:hypothetical protein
VTPRDVLARSLTEQWADPVPGVDHFPSPTAVAEAQLDALAAEGWQVVDRRKWAAQCELVAHLATENVRLERQSLGRDT